MEYKEQLKIIREASYLEDVLRMTVSNNDFRALYNLFKDPEIENIAVHMFRLTDVESLIEKLSSGEAIHSIIRENNKGEKLLVHAVKMHATEVSQHCQMIYCITGKCIMRVNDEDIILNEGDTCIVSPGIQHSYYNVTAATITVHIAMTRSFIHDILIPSFSQLSFNSDMLAGLFYGETDLYPYLLFKGQTDGEMAGFIASAFTYHLEGTAQSKEIVNHFMALFFSCLFRESEMVSVMPSIEEQSKKRIRMLKEYITMNCRTITLKELAEKYYFSESYLSQLLKSQTGETFSDLVQHARINLSMQMLITTNMSVIDIARDVGYHNMNYFYKLFKDQAHCTPAQYRKKQKTAQQYVIGNRMD